MAQSESPPEAPPAAPTAPPLAYPPPFPWGYYTPPSPRPANLGILILIVAVVIVAISAILPAILYFMVSGLLSGPDNQPPAVSLSSPTVQGNTVSFFVVSVTQALPISNFNAILVVNTTNGNSQPLSSSFTITVAGDPYQVSYTDADGGGTLNTNDQFRIAHTGGFPLGTTYEFMLQLNDGLVVALLRWP